VKKYILVIDQGTSGTGVSLVNKQGQIIASSDNNFKQIYPKAGWVEHDANDIWDSVLKGISQLSKKWDLSEVLSIGVTNQRETIVAFDKKGQPLHNAIVWQCRRTHERCESLKKNKKQKLIQKVTGLVVDPYFSATKIEWLLKNSKKVKMGAQNGDLHFGTIDSFIIYKLSGGSAFITDVSNASRTMLMDLKTLNWSKTMLSLFGVKHSYLPKIVASSGVLAKTKKLLSLPAETPITGVAGDQQAALFGQGAFYKGQAKCTFGTGSFILFNTGGEVVYSKNKLVTTVAWQISGQPVQYALEGGAFICGAAMGWLKDNLGIIQSLEQIEPLARSVNSTEGVVFVPALTGLGSPDWEPKARGLIMGLTQATKKSHIVLATLEAMALQNVEILQLMESDLNTKLKVLKVDGGASSNQLLMQMQADYIQTKVERPAQIESTTLGAAYLAGLGIGLWKNQKQIEKFIKIEKQFKPRRDLSYAKQKLNQWKKAVQAVKAQAQGF